MRIFQFTAIALVFAWFPAVAQDSLFPVLPVKGEVVLDGGGMEKTPLLPVEIFDNTGPAAVKVGTASWGASNAGLYLRVDVLGKEIFPSESSADKYSRGFKSDSVEFWIDKSQYCAGFAKGMVPAMWSFKQSAPVSQETFMIVRNDLGYTLEVCLPWSKISKNGKAPKELRLAVGINKVDPRDGKVTQSYMPENWIWGNPRSFAHCSPAEQFERGKHTALFMSSQARAFWPSAAEMDKLTVCFGKPFKTVNRKVFGVCMHAPPWPEEQIEQFRDFLDESSIRVWVRPDSKWNQHWIDFARHFNIAWVVGYRDNSWCRVPAVYNSASDNNLRGDQRAEGVAGFVSRIRKQAGVQLDAFEFWNEPEFKQNGHWKPAPFARYITDCSKALAEADPDVEPGSFLFPGHADNIAFVKNLKPGTVKFLDRHYYNTTWFGAARSGELAYAGKVGFIRRMRERIDQDLAVLGDDIRLISSEWGIHPKGYGKPYTVCHDMGSIIFHASMLMSFMEKDVFAAHYFKISDTSPKGVFSHFRLINFEFPEIGRGNLDMFRNFGKHFRGDLLTTTVSAPEMKVMIPARDTTLTAPVIAAAAAIHPGGKVAGMVLINRHVKLPGNVQLEGLDQWKAESANLMSATLVDSTNIRLKELEPIAVAGKVNLPPKSIMFIKLLKQ